MSNWTNLQINNLQKLLAWKKKRKNIRITFKLFVKNTGQRKVNDANIVSAYDLDDTV